METAAKMDHAVWKSVIAEHTEVGRSMSEFCRQRGLKDHSFYWHKRRMLRDSGQQGFREVRLSPRSPVRIVVPGSGAHVEVDRGFDRQCLRAVVQALQ